MDIIVDKDLEKQVEKFIHTLKTFYINKKNNPNKKHKGKMMGEEVKKRYIFGIK